MSGAALESRILRLLSALGYPVTSAGRTLRTVLVAVATYCLLILSTFPGYSVQLVGSDPAYADEALLALTANTYRTAGAAGLALTVAYAMLTGVAVTAALGRVRTDGATGVGALSAVLPGLLVSGCASCGAGVLGLLGFAGALATLPFDGNLLRLAGVVLLVGYLSSVGDPRRCALTPQADTD
jgi:hypothetical protein